MQQLRHWLLQIIGPVRSPALQVTEAARAQLILRMSEIVDFEPVATVLWAEGDRRSGWGVAFYDKHKRPSGRVVTLNGVPFVFVQHRCSELSGATLDYRDNRFVVEGARDGTAH